MNRRCLKFLSLAVLLAAVLNAGCTAREPRESSERKMWAEGEYEASESLLEFKPNGDGTSEVVGIGTETSTDIVIPKTDIDGNLVTSIAPQAFFTSTITSVSFPDSLKVIGEEAFSSCSNLKSVDIPGSVETLGRSCFFGCFNISEVKLHEGLTCIGEAAFQCCNSLKTIEIPEGVINIEPQAFSFSGLTEIRFPESVFWVGDEVLSHCIDLKKAEIPAAGYLGSYIFYNCGSLKEAVLPDKLPESTGEHLFKDCPSLERINGMDAEKYQAVMQKTDLI